MYKDYFPTFLPKYYFPLGGQLIVTLITLKYHFIFLIYISVIVNNVEHPFLFYFAFFSFFMYMSALAVCTFAHEKRASDPTMAGCEPPCGCWYSTLDIYLTEQPVLFKYEPSL